MRYPPERKQRTAKFLVRGSRRLRRAPGAESDPVTKPLFTATLLLTSIFASFAQPEIVSQPRSAVAAVNDSVLLSAVVRTESPPLTYQWRRDGTNLPGETNRLLRFPSVQFSDEGTYSIEVKDAVGSMISDAARLTVLPRNVTRLGDHELQFGGHQPSWNAVSADHYPIVTRDGLTFYVGSERPGGLGRLDLWMARRPSLSAPWGELTRLPDEVNSNRDEAHPSLSPDGLSLYFVSDRPGGHGTYDLWVTTRSSETAPFGVPQNLGPAINSRFEELFPYISADDLSLYFASERPGGYGAYDIWVSTRATPTSPWEPAVNLGAGVNTGSWEITPVPAPDGLTLFFASNTRTPTVTTYAARRPSRTAPYANATVVNGVFDHLGHTDLGSISADGTTLYVVKDFYYLWEIQVRPVPELRRASTTVETAGDSFALELIGREQGRYRIESTTDFKTWTEVLRTNTIDSTPVTFVDPAEPSGEFRFYRAVGE